MFNSKKFGAFIARKRKAADLTQSELAEKLCLTRQAVSRYELGDSFPDITILIQLSEIFNSTLDELIHAGNSTNGEIKIIKNNFNEVETDEEINISQIVSLVEYLRDEDVLQRIQAADFHSLSGEMLEKIVPFLDAASKEILLKKIIEGEHDWKLIKILIPHMEGAVTQLEAAVIDGALPNEILQVVSDYFWGGKKYDG